MIKTIASTSQRRCGALASQVSRKPPPMIDPPLGSTVLAVAVAEVASSPFHSVTSDRQSSALHTAQAHDGHADLTLLQSTLDTH